MVTQNGGGGSVEEDEDAKHMFDRIGEEVHKKVHTAALQRGKGLHGLLSEAIFESRKIHVTDPCQLNHEIHTNVTSNVIEPCKHKSEKRFSEVSGAECDRKKIKDSENNTAGACAPFRRLHVCDRNLEQIDPDKIESTHNLLVDVCQAAKFEGQSITQDYPKYRATYVDSPSQICTMLARSFADIGDIIRGKDLYRGNKKKNEKDREKERLEQNLRSIFAKIYGTLPEEKNSAYLKDGPNYYQLREDWWTANRETVWKALTCHAVQNDKYFRDACSGGKSSTPNKCRCTTHDVPTYFDYVPQYLRWFEEWAEDFCTKRKHKLKDAIDKCRGKDKSGNERYCDLNGYDCEKTKRGRNKYSWDYKCTGCFLSCSHFRTWIDNQKEQFLKQKEQFDKQKERYDNVINGTSRGSRRQKRGTTTNYEGYESKFYNILKERDYGTVDGFLELLNKETTCEKQPYDDGKERCINFNENLDDIFSHTEYCQACPLCGVQKKNNGSDGNTKWERKDSMEDCPPIKLYKPTSGAKGTTINFLYSGDEATEIGKKLKKFCETKNGSVVGGRDSGTSGSQELYEEWKCYEIDELTKDGQEGEEDEVYNKEVKDAGGLCILQKTNHEGVQKQKTFNPFFYYWVVHMLKDSIHWRTEKLSKCLKNEKEKCGNKKCKGDCDCFQNWITQKKDEWENIKKHFKTQDIRGTVGNGNTVVFFFLDHDAVLEGVLDKEVLLTSLREAYGNAEDIKHIKELLDDEEAVAGVLGGENNTTIDKLLQHEKEQAEQCKQKQEECNKAPKPGGDPGARADTGTSPATPQPRAEEDEEDEDEEEEEEGEVDDVPEAEEEDQVEETAAEGPKEASPSQNEVNPCEIVNTLFTSDDNNALKEACGLKYGPGGKEKFPNWKCVPTKPNDVATGEDDQGSRRVVRSAPETTKSGDTGGLCIPPRRRKLYIGGLTKWAKTVVEPQALSGQTTPATSQSPNGDLLTAFVESAAIETFFLWDRYKKIKLKEKLEEQARQNGLLLGTVDSVDGDSNDPNNIYSGKIPPSFLRQMFYTLGDYRDICVGVEDDVAEALKASGDNKSGDKNIKEISDKIKEILKKQSSPPNSGTTPQQTWWEQNGQHIWKGMVCALTYKEKDEKKIEQVKTADNGNLFDKLKEKYGEWNKVVLKEDETSSAMSTSSSSTSDNTPLTDFISRPTYFRYLEEWGETFCRERQKRLEQVEKNCTQDGDKQYSGDGEECDKVHDDPSNFPDLGYSCPKSCRLYKKWIEKKKEEFTEQEKAYTGQKNNYKTESNCAEGNDHGNRFCGTVKTCDTAGDFLNRLKNGPCKKNSEEGNGKDNQEDEINFNDPEQTFKHTKHCDPCSQFKIDCQKANCTGGDTKSKCNGKTITAETFVNEGDSIGNVGMLVSDKNGGGFDGDLKDCITSGIFEGIRKEQWECGNFCGYVVCKPENGNGKQNESKQIIQINALLQRWVHNFFDNYNKIKHKISHRMNNGEGCKCINGCIEKWVEQKKGEWKTIRDRFKEQYKDNPDYNVKSVLETLITQIPVVDDKGKHDSLQKLKKSFGCNCPENSEKECCKEDTQKDIVECLLDKLGEKATSCPAPTSGEQTETNCVQPSPLEEPDEPLEEENTVEAPKICDDVLKTQTPEEKEEDACKPAAVPGNTITENEEDKPKADDEASGEGSSDSVETPAGESEENPEETPVVKPEPPQEKAPAPAPHPQPPPPLPSDNTSDIVAKTLPFGIALALGSIAFLFLKKKTKSTIDLLRVINIPKSDYNIPTKLSPNRYIPYTSGKYRGKRYIYLEGDSGTDSGYTDHYSDITSSSESEYEEMDINDIYVPGSPKYKTLIEVVLEPSGNNTTASGKNTPSDTQNDIQNDGIPSSKITDNEWNQLKHDFISQYIQSEQPNDVPNDYKSGNSSTNTNITTTSRDNMEEKPFIMSIHDRNLYSGEEYSYNINMSTNSMDDPKYVSNNVYSGIDLINDSLNSGNQHIDIYDEVLKRKENELFGTNHVKQTSIHSVAKPISDDPIHNQLELFHTWLDRHRDMCEQWENHHERLAKLKEEWENDTSTSGNTHPSGNTPPTSDIPSSNKTLNTDVSIQIHMDNPKPINQFTNMDTYPNNSSMDTILEDLDKPFNEPYYYDMYDDDIYYDVHDHDTSTVDSNNMDVPSKVQIEMDINTKLVKEKYPIADVWDI